MFNKRSRIINSFDNIYHLEKESNINVGISYLLLIIPIIILFFIIFLQFFNIIKFRLVFSYELLVIVTAFINLYRVSWTYKDSLRCLLTFLGAVVCFFIFTACFNNSPLSYAPAKALIDWVVSEVSKYISNLDDYRNYQQSLSLLYNYNFQTLAINKLQSFLSLLYAHAIYVFIIHYQVRETQTMMNFYNLGIEPKLIADYIIDPEKNKKIEEEAIYRAYSRSRNSDQERFNKNYKYSCKDEYEKSLEKYDQNSNPSKKAEDFMKPIVPKKNINDE